MNEKKMNITIDLMNLIIYFCCFFCILAPLLYGITHSRACIAWSLLLLPMMVLSYLARIHTVHLFSFLIIHIAMILMTLFLPLLLPLKAIFILIIIPLTGISLYLRFNTSSYKKENASPLLLLFVFAGYLLCCKMKYYFLIGDMQKDLFLITLIYCTNAYFINFRTYFITNLGKANVHMSGIHRTCNHMMTGFLALCGVIMVVLAKLPTKQLLNKIGDFFLGILRWLFSLLTSNPAPNAPNAPQPTPTPNPEDIVIGESKENFLTPFWDLLDKISYYLFNILLVLGSIALIVILCYLIYKKFHSTAPKGTDELEFLSPFHLKKEKASMHKRYSLHSFSLFSSNRDKMRKHFYRTAKPKVDHNKAMYFTSKQITSLLSSDEKNPDCTEFYRLYDKARYGEEDCTSKDYQSMKKMKF